MAQLCFNVALVCGLLLLKQAERRVGIACVLGGGRRGWLCLLRLRRARRLMHKAAKLVSGLGGCDSCLLYTSRCV